MSESGGEFSNPPKWVPKTYLDLFNAVQCIDKMGKSHLFVITSLVYSNGLQIHSRINMNNLIYVKNILYSKSTNSTFEYPKFVNL